MKPLFAGLLVLLPVHALANGATQEGRPEEAPPYVHLVASQKYEEALPLVRRAAKAGEPEGLFHLARYYAEGWAGEDINKSLSMKHFQQAARRGHAKSERFLQALHDAGTRLSAGAKVPNGRAEVPVYLLFAGGSEDASGQGSGFVFDGETMALMAERVHLSPKASTVRLAREPGHLTLRHEPENGHSSWRFPNFAPVEADEEKELWREVRLEFSLPPGKTFADYEIPVSFQTNLAASNVVNLFIYKSGRISLQTATARGEYEYQFHSSDALDPNVVNLLELFTSSHGNWVLRVNGNMRARGAFDPRYFHNGLSNRAYFEGSVNIHSIALRELLPRKVARGNPEFTLREISRIEKKSSAGYLDHYMAQLRSGQEEAARWRFGGTTLHYLRREIEFMEMPDKSIVRRPMYILESLVRAKSDKGEPVVFPVQKSLAVGTTEDWMTGTVNRKKTAFRVHLNSVEKSDVYEYSGRVSRIGKD